MSPAVKIGMSVSLATGLYGVSFGALAVASGLSPWQAIALSALMFTGGSQFAFLGVVGGGGTPGAATAAASLVGIRNAIYGVQSKIRVRPTSWRVPVAAHLTIDESVAVSSSQDDPAEVKRGFWVTGIGVFITWNLFTILGVVAGNAMGDPQAWGLDGAAVAAFMGLLWPRLRAAEPVAIAVACAAVTIIAVPFLPPGLPILAAALTALAWAVVR